MKNIETITDTEVDSFEKELAWCVQKLKIEQTKKISIYFFNKFLKNYKIMVTGRIKL